MQISLSVGSGGGLKIWEQMFILHTPESQETKRNLDSMRMNCYFIKFN
jgi:hypothetical protein